MITWVVVPNHNGRRWLPGLMASLAAQELQPHHVVVVDDGSTDDSVLWLERQGVAVLRREHRGGFAAAVNTGLGAATDAGADAVALINTDVELSSDWLGTVVAALVADPQAGSIATKMVRLDDPHVIDDAGNILRRDGVCEQRGRGHIDQGRWDAPGEVWGACAGAVLYRVSALRQVSGFDERYGMYLEDVDLALRLRLGGWTCAYVPAVARHAGQGSRVAVTQWVARNTVVLVARWYPLRWLPMVLYRQVSWLVAAARQRALRAHIHGLVAGVRAIPATLSDRRRAGGSPYASIADAVPDRPWRGSAAGGHRKAAE